MRTGHKMNRNGLSQMFNDGETEIRSVMGGNVHEKGGSKVQQGGTCMLLYGSLIDQYDFEASGKDAMSRLGLSADTIHIRQGGKATKSRYQQHRRYFIRREKDRTCLRRTRFGQDLMKQLIQWRKEGARLVVCTWLNAITAGFYDTWPGLTYSNASKYCSAAVPTTKRHMTQMGQGVRCEIIKTNWNSDQTTTRR